MSVFDATNSFDKSFDIFGIMFFLIFGLILVVFVVVIVSGISRWTKNNQSPVLTVNAAVVAKRTDVSRNISNTNDNTDMLTNSTTWYYATFQVESGDRIELAVNGKEYGLLAENDSGRLTFQGTRYLGFERARQVQPPN